MCGQTLEVEVRPGNVHDSVAFDAVYEHLTVGIPSRRSLPPMQNTKHHGAVSRSLAVA